ncbi:MAG: hypothetical protein ACLFTN_13900 [Phycisphaerae bacterium]
MALWNTETRGIQAAFRGKPICARCDRPTFGPGLCSDCHTRFRQGLSDALFTIGAMVAVPCVVGAAFLWFAHGREIAGGEVPENATIILGRAMGPDAASIFRHLAISALTAALLSIGSFLLLDLPRVLRRDKRLEIDWRDMVASLKDIRLLFEKRVTPAGPRPGEPESANPLDYQTAMQQLHSMLGIEGDIPPDPTAEKDEPAPKATADPPPRGSAVRDVETIESLVTPSREDRPQEDLPDEPEPVAATRSDQVEDTVASTETAQEPAVEEDLPEPAAEATAPPLPAAQPLEPSAVEVDEVHPPVVDAEPEPAAIGEEPPQSPAGLYESGDADEETPPEQDPCLEEPPTDESDDGHEHDEHTGPDRPTVQVKDSPFAQRHRLRQPLFETTPPPPGRDDDEDRHPSTSRRSVVDDLLDEPVAQLFDRPALPGLLQVKISEWDDLPTTEFVPENSADLTEQAQTPGSPETEWLDEEEASADLDEADILDIECVPAQTDQDRAPEPAPSTDDDTTISDLLGENEEADTIDALLGEPEESSTIDEMLDELTQAPTPETTRQQEDEPPVAETAEPGNEKAPDPASGPETEPSAEPAPSADEETRRSTTDEPDDAPETDRSEPEPDEPADARILLRGPKGASGIETSLTDTDGNVACPGCGRRKPSPGPGRYHCSSCRTEFVIPRVLARCPGCGRERPSPGPGVYQCSQCTTTFRIPPMVSCPGCGRSKPSPGTGRLRCSACGTVFEVINETGAVR